MGLLYLRHRYLIRQYVYPLMCILFIILLIRWNTEPRRILIGRQGHEFDDSVQTLKSTLGLLFSTFLSNIF